MTPWLGWKKVALILSVFAAHIGLLTGFNFSFASGKSGQSTKSVARSLVVSLRTVATVPLAEGLPKPREPNREERAKPAEASSATTTQQSVLPETPSPLGLKGGEYFLDADSLDKTAQPLESFETQLSLLLPLNIQTVVLEFWIEKDGRAVEVRCVEGACSEAVNASLPKLTNLEFLPALKNGEATASRKVIQVDLRSGLGF